MEDNRERMMALAYENALQVRLVAEHLLELDVIPECYEAYVSAPLCYIKGLDPHEDIGIVRVCVEKKDFEKVIEHFSKITVLRRRVDRRVTFEMELSDTYGQIEFVYLYSQS